MAGVADWWDPSLRPLAGTGTDESVTLTGPALGATKSPVGATDAPHAGEPTTEHKRMRAQGFRLHRGKWTTKGRVSP